MRASCANTRMVRVLGEVLRALRAIVLENAPQLGLEGDGLPDLGDPIKAARAAGQLDFS